MVGGADKSFNQIKDIPNSYFAIDNVEFGRGNKIPLCIVTIRTTTHKKIDLYHTHEIPIPVFPS